MADDPCQGRGLSTRRILVQETREGAEPVVPLETSVRTICSSGTLLRSRRLNNCTGSQGNASRLHSVRRRRKSP